MLIVSMGVGWGATLKPQYHALVMAEYALAASVHYPSLSFNHAHGDAARSESLT